MFIKKVIQYDSYSKEAEILVSDGEHNIKCCAWNFNKNIDKFTLSAFLVQNVERSNEPKSYAVSNDNSYFAYDICGKLKDNGKIAVGAIVIDIEIKDIPKDIHINDFVKLSCIRIDFIQ